MACSADGDNKCDACFNWGSGHLGARALDMSVDPPNCVPHLGLYINGCKWYKGTTLTTDTVRTLDDCTICNTEYLSWESTTNIATCTNEVPDSCYTIDNCLTTVCYNTSHITHSSGCRMCKKNYSGTNFDLLNSVGSQNCEKTNTILNCEFVMELSATEKKCYSCMTDYAVSNDQLTCISYSFDKWCRILDGDHEGCWYCWHSYYWSGSLCKLYSN